MKHWKYILIGFGLLMVGAAETYAQEFKRDVLAMHEAYDCLDYLSMNVEIKYFENGLEGEVGSVERALVRIGDKKSYSLYNGLEQLVNDQYFVLVDHEHKEIVFYEHGQNLQDYRQNEINPLVEAYGDSMINSIGKSSFLGIENGSLVYEIVDEKAQLYKTRMYIGKKHHLITRVTMFYQDGSDAGLVVDVHYNDISLNPSFDSQSFSQHRFFKEQGGDFVPVESLKNYTLINTKEL